MGMPGVPAGPGVATVDATFGSPVGSPDATVHRATMSVSRGIAASALEVRPPRISSAPRPLPSPVTCCAARALRLHQAGRDHSLSAVPITGNDGVMIVQYRLPVLLSKNPAG